MLNLKGKHGSKQSTLHQQLLQSHLRVAGLAAIAFVLVAVAMQLLNNPIKSIQSVNIPTANAAMTIQLGHNDPRLTSGDGLRLRSRLFVKTLITHGKKKFDPRLNR